jgi:hypothetical protein
MELSNFLESFDGKTIEQIARKWSGIGDTNYIHLVPGRTGNCLALDNVYTGTSWIKKTLHGETSINLGIAIKHAETMPLDEPKRIMVISERVSGLSYTVWITPNNLLAISGPISQYDTDHKYLDSKSFPQNQWFYFEFAFQFIQNGFTAMRKENDDIISWGESYCPYNPNSGDIDITLLGEGVPGWVWFDDMYIVEWPSEHALNPGIPISDWLGRIKVERLQPIAAGSRTEFTPSVVGASNYELVNDSNDNTFVASGTNNATDLYTMSDSIFSATNTTIKMVQIECTVKGVNGGKTVSPIIKVNGTEYTGVPGPTNDEATAITWGMPIQPDSNNWSSESVNTLEAGLKICY